MASLGRQPDDRDRRKRQEDRQRQQKPGPPIATTKVASGAFDTHGPSFPPPQFALGGRVDAMPRLGTPTFEQRSRTCMTLSYWTARSPRRITAKSGVVAIEERNWLSSSAIETGMASIEDRKSTRLNSS